MKANIDLTDSRDFPDRPQAPRDVLFGTKGRSIPPVTVPEWATTFVLSLAPWELHKVNSEDDFLYDSNFDPVFPTGTRDEIIHRTGVMIACSDKYCDRCGKIINPVPWEKKWGLCDSCKVALEKEFGGGRAKEMPWEINPNIISIGDIV